MELARSREDVPFSVYSLRHTWDTCSCKSSTDSAPRAFKTWVRLSPSAHWASIAKADHRDRGE